MGLKDDLIKRAAGGSSFVRGEQKAPEIEEQPAEEATSSLTSGFDLSDILESNPLEEAFSQAAEEEQSGLDDMYNDPLPQSNFQQPQAQFNPYETQQPEPIQQQPEQDFSQDFSQMQYTQPQAQFSQPQVFDTHQMDNPYGDQMYQQPQQQFYQPQPTVSFEQTYAPQPIQEEISTPSGLEAQLLLLAKKVILEDITQTFTSDIVTKNALEKLVNSYLDQLDSPYTNSNAVLVSVIDEILESNYTHDHYGELVPQVLQSVKADLQ